MLIETRAEMVGAGCFYQGLGVVALVVGGFYGVGGIVFGLVAFLALFHHGSQRARVPICGACRNTLASRDVRVCPVCHASLSVTPPTRMEAVANDQPIGDAKEVTPATLAMLAAQRQKRPPDAE